MLNVCFSGDAAGADTLFGTCAEAAGHKVIHYHFGRPKAKDSPNIIRLSQSELERADPALALANKTLGRRWPVSNDHVASLLRRNFWQIVDSDCLYAVASIDNHQVNGGTAWAVEMFKNVQAKNCYVFDQYRKAWFWWNYMAAGWILLDEAIPLATGNYTGIGSRVLTEDGVAAIQSLYS